MSRMTVGSLLVLVPLTLLPGCGKEPPQDAAPGPEPRAGAPVDQFGGTVLETMTSGGFTYARLGQGDKEIWIAGPETQLAVGDEVTFPGQPMVMRDFHSKTLDRTFEVVYFASAINKAGAAAGMPQPHPVPAVSGTDIDLSGIARAEGGRTVAEIFAAKDRLAGKKVLVRGKVVKANAGILDRNWLHVRDGTGTEDANDLTVTTTAVLPKVGDTVLVTGKVALDKDFGFGYRYPVIVEDAEIVVE